VKTLVSNIILLMLLLITSVANAQVLGTARTKKIPCANDTVQLDTLSLVPGSVFLLSGDTIVYSVDEAKSLIIFSNHFRNRTDSVEFGYRVFPLLFGKETYLRDRKLLERGNVKASSDPYFVERPTENKSGLFGLDGLNRSGSISRGITVGTNQDAVVSSSLNLQLAGKIGGGIDIVAAITDDNIPVQADGNTQQLQEFDKVFIQLSNKNHKLIAGDFEVRNSDGYFMRYFKKGQGGLYSYTNDFARKNGTKGVFNFTGGAAVSKGKFARQTFQGVESNQGPYRLRGAENESFIVILSGSEQIYLDGILLQRGQDRDYVIDYNTAEIKFTAKRIINKDSRIIAEYQYSDKNYARTMLTGAASWKSKKLTTYINYFNEQDSKNQPVQQDLSSDDKSILANAGDNLSQAIALNVDSVAFNSNEILYAKRDTIVNGITYSPIYVYSTNSDSARYRAGFSNVGLNKGNYIAVDNVANGRLYQWVAPLSGIPQGSYEPYVLLIAPKQRQLITAGAAYQLSNATKMSLEIATSKNDINKFSTKDKSNDIGTGVKFAMENAKSISSDTSGWKLISGVQAEFTDKYFVPVENYRAVEFTRDWNTAAVSDTGNEIITSVHTGLHHNQKGDVRYTLKSYQRGSSYNGLMNSLSGQLKPGKYVISAEGSYLTTKGTSISSSYIRHREDISRKIGGWLPGVRFEQEQNEISSIKKDSLAIGSFSWKTGEAYLQHADTTKWPMKFNVSRRYEDGLKDGALKAATIADMAGFGISTAGKKQKIGLQLNYRNLKVQDTLVTTLTGEESASGRLDYTLNAIKNAVQINAYYEGGTGREPKKQYSYVQVAAGTGVYAWNDYNGDAIPQINEFEVASFQDQANYIRVFTTTDEYVKVVFNQMNFVLNINPSNALGANSKSFLKKFSILSTVRFDNRVNSTGSIDNWNPIPSAIADSMLVSTQTNGRHSLFFMRSDPKFSTDFNYQHLEVKQLLSNGIESRNVQTISQNIRWNFTQEMGIQLQAEVGEKKSAADAFSNRNYNIQRYAILPKLNIQPGTNYKVTVSYRYENKENILKESLGETANIQDAGVEWRYSTVKKGVITAKFNYVDIKYNSEANSAIGYEMLEGLKTGSNYTWGLSIQRNLGNSLQIGINYDGRKPADVKVIHTGGAQVRAYF